MRCKYLDERNILQLQVWLICADFEDMGMRAYLALHLHRVVERLQGLMRNQIMHF